MANLIVRGIAHRHRLGARSDTIECNEIAGEHSHC